MNAAQYALLFTGLFTAFMLGFSCRHFWDEEKEYKEFWLSFVPALLAAIALLLVFANIARLIQANL